MERFSVVPISQSVNTLHQKGNNMIKIIKQGKIPVTHKEITCYHCKTIFSYEQDDIVCEDRGWPAPCATPYVICPLCGKSNNTMKPYMPF